MSASLPQVGAQLPPCTPDDLAKVMKLRRLIDERTIPCEFPTEAFFHAGCYVRTCKVPRDTLLAGAVIKVPTVLVVCGHCYVTTGSNVQEIDGFAVLRGAPGRSQVFRALEDTYLTMVYASKAESLDAAEEEFTDEFEELLTRKHP